MLHENRPLTSIRGFAALWVVGYHWTGMQGQNIKIFALGYTAVDLFFILSGLILAGVYGDLEPSGVPGFCLKRIFRLYPLHLAVLAFFMPMLVYVLVQHGRMDMFSWNGVLASALLVFPFLSTTSLTNAPSWSIGVELVCYLLFPFLIVIWRLFGPHSFGARLVAAMTILALLYVKLAIIPQYSTSIDGIGAVLRGLVGFVLGMALWRLRDNLGVGFAPSPARLTSGEISSLAGMGLAVYLDQPQWVVIFAASLLFCLSFDAGRVARALRARWCLWLGHISFSVYLLHYPLIVMFNQWFPARMLPVHGGIGRTVWTLGVIAALLGLSTLTFRYIEVPARRIPHRLARRRASSVIDRMPLERLSS